MKTRQVLHLVSACLASPLFMTCSDPNIQGKSSADSAPPPTADAAPSDATAPSIDVGPSDPTTGTQINCLIKEANAKLYAMVHETTKHSVLVGECQFAAMYALGYRPWGQKAKAPTNNLAKDKQNIIGCMATGHLQGPGDTSGLYRLTNTKDATNLSFAASQIEVQKRLAELKVSYAVQPLNSDFLLGYFLPESSDFVTLRRAFDKTAGQYVFYVKEVDEARYNTSQYSLQQDLGRIFDANASTGECADLKYSRKGIAVDWRNPPSLDLIQTDWYYDWKTKYNLQFEKDPRYVRMIWCSGYTTTDIAGKSYSLEEVAKADADARLHGRVWLLLNEPDDKNQCGRTWLDKPKEAADYFIEASKRIKSGDPTAKVYGAGLVWLRTSVAKNWWTAFVDQLKAKGELARLEGMHMHMYPFITTSSSYGQYIGCDASNSNSCFGEVMKAARDWHQEMHVAKGLGNLPVFITETGWLSSKTTMPQDRVRSWFMKPLLQAMLDNQANPFLDNVSWFVTTTHLDTESASFLYSTDLKSLSGLGDEWSAKRF